MEETVNIILKEDIQLTNGYLYKAKSVYENVQKYTDFRNRICYEPVEGNVIIDNDNVIELGFIFSETFKRIKSIKTVGEFNFEDIQELIKKVEQFEGLVEDYSKEILNFKDKIEDLNNKCDTLYKFGEF
jgi:hypothetical protein